MTPRSRFQPEFRHFSLLLSVNMWRLRTLVAVEKEAKWADSGDRRHRQILPDCSSVPVALPAAGRALHAGVTDGVRREYRVLGRPGYRPGTWFTDLTGDMVDSFAQDGGEGVRDAVERNDEDAGANEVRAGCGGRAVHDDGAVRAIRDQPDDGAQVGQAVPGGWSGRSWGPEPGAGALPSSDRCGSGGSPGGGLTPTPQLGRP